MFHLLILIIYLAFISLGLPDAMLGSSWPLMQKEMDVPLSYAGILSMIIALGTIVSSLYSDRINKKLGTPKMTVLSALLTAIGLFGFSISTSFWMLILFSIPYGLGAGGIDAALNNYVAIHYSSKHMSWLHCMWGLGASIGPYIMSYSLISSNSWNNGYMYVAIIQIILTFIIFISIPIWKKSKNEEDENNSESKPLKLIEIIRLIGAKEVMITFFCYCAIEQTAGLWASSYLIDRFSISVETAASFASLFYIGITIGRAISGFLTIKFNDNTMIRSGMVLIVLGIIFLILPFNVILSYIGLIIIGLGCAPIYPCIIHSTPSLFGENKSQAIIGVEMASAYIGTCIMPPIFGLLANYISLKLYPFYMLLLLIVMWIMFESLIKLSKRKNK